ncbi:DUF3617 family protein [Asticcacaulis sp. YBE204]|uniref:DUF3617 domain-containing protein n=1 Tax=Asticcacaulis sp. YBE204 TaxID=1282363 RepID=UPI0003C3AE8C|nr:DUF3617 family protein [Asticcacaulis sp. YBE204]ESQ76949.1 hypothetical protein AEYBE204_18915 [Asticcacaulis sp. YBE204]
MSVFKRIGGFVFAFVVMGVVPVVSMALNEQAVAATENPSTGKDEAWEVTAMTRISGLSLPANTDTVCLSAEDRRNPPKALSSAQCPNQQITRDGNTVRWVAKCDKADATGQITFAGDTLTGKVSGTKSGTRVDIDLSGRRVGNCTKS